jgi:hypothetical protein
LLGLTALLGGCAGAPTEVAVNRQSATTPADNCYWVVAIEDRKRWPFAIQRGVLTTSPKGDMQSIGVFGSNDNPWQVANAKYTHGWAIPYTFKSGPWAGYTAFFGLAPDASEIAWWAFDWSCGEINSFTPPPTSSGHRCVSPEMSQLDPGDPPTGSGNPWCPDGCPPPTINVCVPKDLGSYAKLGCGSSPGIVQGAAVCCKPITCKKNWDGDYPDGCGGTITCYPPDPPPNCGGKGKPQCI